MANRSVTFLWKHSSRKLEGKSALIPNCGYSFEKVMAELWPVNYCGAMDYILKKDARELYSLPREKFDHAKNK